MSKNDQQPQPQSYVVTCGKCSGTGRHRLGGSCDVCGGVGKVVLR